LGAICIPWPLAQSLPHIQQKPKLVEKYLKTVVKHSGQRQAMECCSSFSLKTGKETLDHHIEMQTHIFAYYNFDMKAYKETLQLLPKRSNFTLQRAKNATAVAETCQKPCQER